MEGILDWLYAKKAYVASIILAAENVWVLWLAASADEAISLDEGKGLLMAVSALVGVIGIHIGVFNAKNASRPS